jgi:hypothetical protein
MPQKFKGRLLPAGPSGAWTFLEIPPEVSASFGVRGRIAVAGTVNGFAFRNFLMPTGDGTHQMMFSKELQAGAKAKAGERVAVVMEVDSAPRTVSVPADLKAALAAKGKLRQVFDELAYTHRKDFVNWIVAAKRPETRAARIAKALDMLASGRKYKDL